MNGRQNRDNKNRKEQVLMGDAAITRKIISYIEDHLDKDLTLEKIAAAQNYSKFYMVRVFKEHTGITPYQYIRSRRLEKAAEKLVKTDLPVVEISMEAGYGSQQAFGRVFRCEYGCTPLEYRRAGVFIPRHSRIFMGGKENGTGVLWKWGKGRTAA